MKRKSREEVLLDRLRSKGLESDLQQKGAPFKFVVSPTICAGIDSADVRRLALAFKREVFNRIKAEKLETTLTGIVMFPQILDPELVRKADKLTYKRKDHSYFVMRNVSFEAWQEGSWEVRLKLFAENLCDSILSIPMKHLSGRDKKMIVAAIEAVRAELKMGNGQRH